MPLILLVVKQVTPTNEEFVLGEGLLPVGRCGRPGAAAVAVLAEREGVRTGHLQALHKKVSPAKNIKRDNRN